ncbi:hypothetical protein ACB092_07G117200, partial [Castanea dentata]
SVEFHAILRSYTILRMILPFLRFYVVIFGTQSHSLNTLKLASSFGEMEGPGHGLSLRTTKHSGPSRDGGHKSRITRILREGRHSGPSPGEGHKH